MGNKCSSTPIGPVDIDFTHFQKFGNFPLPTLGDLQYLDAASHVGRSLFGCYCKHCSLSYKFKLTDDPDEQYEIFYAFHSNCILPTVPMELES